MSLPFDEPSAPFTLQDHEVQIFQDYKNTLANRHRHAGAKAFLAYLHGQQKSLAEVTKRELQEWSLTPHPTGRSQGSLPSERAFVGAQELCVFAAEAGYIDGQRGKELAECPRPQNDLNLLRAKLQNPALTRQECEDQIGRHYQNAENNPSRQAGARAFLAYLAAEQTPLAGVTKSNLEAWVLTLLRNGGGKNNVLDAQAFEGAKALCGLAVEVGHIQGQRASYFAECKFPSFSKDFLRIVFQNSQLTPSERDQQILFNYQCLDKDPNRRSGANSFLAYLKSQATSLSEVRTSDLERWARTSIATAKGRLFLPNPKAFDGAKALCALTAELGQIDPQRAKELAFCVRPRGELDVLRSALQDPALTPQDRENRVRLHYRSAENDANRQTGASAFQAYLKSQNKLLAEATTSDLKQWALTPLSRGKDRGNLPSAQGFEGAKALCLLAAELGHIDANSAQGLAQCTRPRLDVELLRSLLQNPRLTPPEREQHIFLKYQSMQKDHHFQAGAKGFLAYLEGQGNSLAEVTKSDLAAWALTPVTAVHGRLILPNMSAFAGAKGLCALAAEVGYLNPPTAEAIAQCRRPHFDVELLRTVLQNPALTSKEREHQILLNYQSTVKDHHYLAGANGFCAYLELQGTSLAAVTKSDLDKWARTTIAKGKGMGSFPSERAFAGAKAFIALAAQVGYIDQQRAEDIAPCQRPPFDMDFLRSVLDDPAITPKAREHHILQSYQSTQRDSHRQAGANGILAYLESQASSLANISKRDLQKWALTPISNGPGKGNFPSARAFEGAKALCALAAEVGYIDGPTAQELAACKRSQQDLEAQRTAPGSNKRQRRDDQSVSIAQPHSFALPQSNEWQREFALSPATSSQTASIQSLIHDVQFLETLHDSPLRFYSQCLQLKATISRLMTEEPECLQRAKDLLFDSHPSASRRLLELEKEVLNSG